MVSRCNSSEVVFSGPGITFRPLVTIQLSTVYSWYSPKVLPKVRPNGCPELYAIATGICRSVTVIARTGTST